MDAPPDRSRASWSGTRRATWPTPDQSWFRAVSGRYEMCLTVPGTGATSARLSGRVRSCPRSSRRGEGRRHGRMLCPVAGTGLCPPDREQRCRYRARAPFLERDEGARHLQVALWRRVWCWQVAPASIGEGRFQTVAPRSVGVPANRTGKGVSADQFQFDLGRPSPGAFAAVAQLVEHLFCKQAVRGSSPLPSSVFLFAGAPEPRSVPDREVNQVCAGAPEPRSSFPGGPRRPPQILCWRGPGAPLSYPEGARCPSQFSPRGLDALLSLSEGPCCLTVPAGALPQPSEPSRAYFDMYFSDRDGDERTRQRQSLEGFPSGQWEQAVNLPAFAFVGSNPTPSTASLANLPRAAQPGQHGSGRVRAESFGRTERRPRRAARRAQRRMSVSHDQGLVRGRRSPRAEACVVRGRAVLRAGQFGGARASISAGVAQLVERQFSKLNVASSILVSRSLFSNPRGPEPTDVSLVRGARCPRTPLSDSSGLEPTSALSDLSGLAPNDDRFMVRGARGPRPSSPAHLAQLVEHVLGKDEVTSSILVVGSKL